MIFYRIGHFEGDLATLRAETVKFEEKCFEIVPKFPSLGRFESEAVHLRYYIGRNYRIPYRSAPSRPPAASNKRKVPRPRPQSGSNGQEHHEAPLSWSRSAAGPLRMPSAPDDAARHETGRPRRMEPKQACRESRQMGLAARQSFAPCSLNRSLAKGRGSPVPPGTRLPHVPRSS